MKINDRLIEAGTPNAVYNKLSSSFAIKKPIL